jgi:hypothetical protein
MERRAVVVVQIGSIAARQPAGCDQWPEERQHELPTVGVAGEHEVDALWQGVDEVRRMGDHDVVVTARASSEQPAENRGITLTTSPSREPRDLQGLATRQADERAFVGEATDSGSREDLAAGRSNIAFRGEDAKRRLESCSGQGCPKVVGSSRFRRTTQCILNVITR